MKRLLTLSLLLLLFSISLTAQNNTKEEISTLNSRIEKLRDIKNWRNDLLHKQEYSTPNGTTLDKYQKFNKVAVPQSGFLLTEKLIQWWGESTWDDGQKDIYTYDANNNLMTDIWQTNNGSGLENNMRSTYTYDMNNNVTSELDEVWNNSVWENQYQISYEYTSNTVTSYFKGWNGLSWDEQTKRTYTYNGNNSLTDFLTEGWDGEAWQNDIEEGFSYDVNNNLLVDLTQLWNGSAWVNFSKVTNTYNNNLVSITILQIWGGSIWVNIDKGTYSYDANNNQIVDSVQAWNANVWVNHFKGTYIFNANNLQTGWVNQTWGGSDWVNSDQGTYGYDANNNQIETIEQSWNGTGWDNLSRIQNSYSAITAVESISSLPTSYKLSNNYPNPFNPTTTIGFSIPKQSFVTLKVYDLLGREVATLVNDELQAGSYKTQFDASNLSSGVYLYRLNADGFIQTKKLMLMK